MKTLFPIILVFLSLVISTNAQYVLEFDGDDLHNVVYPNLYRDYTPAKPQTYGDFTVDTWVKQRPTGTTWANGGYGLPSVGRGGTHAFLAGLFKNANGAYSLAGNFDTVTQACTPTESYQVSNNFATPHVFEENIWTLISYELYNGVFTVYKNGSPVYKKTGIIGSRIAGACTINDPSSQDLYVGGSDHIHASQRLASIRLFEGQGIYQGRGFTPFVTLATNIRLDGINVSYPSLMSDFTVPASYALNFGSGGGLESKSAGFLNSSKNGLAPRNPAKTFPTWVEDLDFPLWNPNWNASTAPPQETLPGGTVIGDTFSRADTDPFESSNTLGQTEIGNKTWNFTLSNAFRIVGGGVVYVKNNVFTTADVDGVANGTLKIKRGIGNSTGVNFRRASQSNYLMAFVQGDRLFLGRRLNGVFSYNHQAVSANWSDIQITFNGSTVTAVSGGTTVNWTDNDHQGNTGTGLFVWTVNQASLWAWDDFEMS